MPSYHNGQELPDICSTRRGFVRPPSAGREIFCCHRHRASPDRSDECAVRIRSAKWCASQSGYHSPCLNIDAAANPLLSAAGQLRLHLLSPQAFWCRVHWQLLRSRISGRRLLQRVCCVLRLFWPCPWGLGRCGPPKTRLAHCGVRSLPLEIYAAKFGATANESSPYLVEQPALYPPLKRAMNGTVVRKLFGQLVPLTAGSQAKDYRIQCTSLVDPAAPGVFGRIEFPDYWFYVVPQFIRHVPNRWQRLNLTFFSHLCILSRSVHRCYRSFNAF